MVEGILGGGRTGRRVSLERIRRVALLAVAMAIAAPTGPLLARAKELVISLRFVPTNRDQVLKKHGVTPASGPALEIPALVDGRSGGPDLVGENREHMPNAVPVRASSDVVVWASQAVGQTLAGWGLRSEPGAPLVLQGELLKLFSAEEHTYKAEAGLKFTLKRRDGTVLWTGVVGGLATRFGRSLKEDNYQQVLSDALFESVTRLWLDPGFHRAWTGREEVEKTKGPEGTVGTGGTGGTVGTDGAGTPAPGKRLPAETLDPEALKKKLLDLKDAGFESDTLVAYVRRVRLTRPLTSDDMIDWKKAGVPQPAIKAAVE